MRPFIDRFSKICLTYQRNIISKKKNEFIFHDAETLEVKILSGVGSYQVFRNNFFERLAEVFCNLGWAAPQVANEDKEIFMQEYSLYKRFYLEIKKHYGEIPFLEHYFNILERAVKGR